MRRLVRGLAWAGLFATTVSQLTQAQGKGEWSFQRVGTFANYKNLDLDDIDKPTVSEIIAATADGTLLIYSDALGGRIGFIDITDPSSPTAAGTMDLDPDPEDDNNYSPTSVGVVRNQYALVAVDTSVSKAEASGILLVSDIATRVTAATIDLRGQPDSIKVSPDHRFIAIAIENQRDEAFPMPQSPAGYLSIIETAGSPGSWVREDVALTGLAAIFPSDPEPEFVDINQANQAVVTLQENNHIVIVDLPSRTVVTHFSAGNVNLSQIDTIRAGPGIPNTISLVNTQSGRLREPDAVAWVGDRIATANEGDLNGGSRGFSIFNTGGSVAFDIGNALEHLAVSIGHYPERRSNAKGTEPEAIVAATFGPNELLFVGTERAGLIAMYKLGPDGQPVFSQVLPAPFQPEGLLTIPHRNLLVASGESDTPSFGVRSTVQIYELKSGNPTYPQIYSTSSNPTNASPPIPWSALSGMTEIPNEAGTVQAIWDSFFTPTRVFTIDVEQTPARITGQLTINRPSASPFYDPEGLSYAPDGSLWIASEGNADDSRANRLIHVDPATGDVLAEIQLPADVLTCRTRERAKAISADPPPANGTGTFGSGFEGLDIQPKPGTDDEYVIYVAQQRGWNYTTPAADGIDCNSLDDDPDDTDAAEPRWTRIWTYDSETGVWSHIPYEFEPKTPNAAWVGLSEITLVDDAGTPGWILIERDNLSGDFGLFKSLVKLPGSPGPDGKYTRSEKTIFDLRPSLLETNGWITDKPEGVAVLPDGRLFVVTDNDGVDGWSGETWFLPLGHFWSLFE